VRAALCTDAETARGARRWNDANVLVLSNRLVSPPVASEMLDAWFTTDTDPSEAEAIASLEGHG
jgi:ribose 5-phosphate isomerase B